MKFPDQATATRTINAAQLLPPRPLSGPIIVGLLRVAGLMIIGTSGVLASFAAGATASDFLGLYLVPTLLGMAVAGFVFEGCGVYDYERVFSHEPKLGRMLVACFFTWVALLSIAFILKATGTYSRAWGIYWFIITACLFIGLQIAFVPVALRWARDGRIAERTVIYGASKHGQRLAEYLKGHGDVRTNIIGFADDRATRVPQACYGYPVLGDCEALVRLIRTRHVDQVVIALPWAAEDRIVELVRQLSLTPVNIRMAPDWIGFKLPCNGFTSISGLSVLRIFDRPISGWSCVLKELEDSLLGAAFLVVFGPIMAAAALAIKLDSPGPVFFRQERYGFNDELINVWKFRTMFQHMTDLSAERLVTRDDPRVTRVGRLLRQTSLDELPQLINVIKREMSLVGPRPHALAAKAGGKLYQEVVMNYAARHRVKPGITGWAQVNGWRGETDTIEKIKKRIECDLYYIDAWSLWLDLKILLMTVRSILSRTNSY